MTKIKAFFFDRGNTTHNCLNGPPHNEKSEIRNNCMLQALNSLYSISIPLHEISDKIILPWYETFQYRDSRGTEVSLEKYIQDFLDTKKIQCSENEIKKIIQRYAEMHKIWDIPNPGIGETLRVLKKRKLFIGILSNSAMPGYVYQEIYKHNNLDQYIDDYVFSYDVGMRKPNKDIFNYACKKNNLDPEKCVMIGDKVDKDIAGAKKIGMKTILYNRKRLITDHDADYEIDDFYELISIIDRIN